MGDAPEDLSLLCHRCGAALAPGEGTFWVARIEAFADPTPPPLDRHTSLAELAGEIDDLVKRATSHSQQELMDQVHRRLTLLLCAPCYHRWIENPTG